MYPPSAGRGEAVRRASQMKICEKGRRRKRTLWKSAAHFLSRRPSAARAESRKFLRQLIQARPVLSGGDAARGQLTAGGVDVAPARASDEGVDALRFEYRFESLHALFRRR